MRIYQEGDDMTELVSLLTKFWAIASKEPIGLLCVFVAGVIVIIVIRKLIFKNRR